MSTIASSIARHARIIVTPTPTTLLESTAILKALQSFGPVSTFLNPRYIPALKDRARGTFYAIFSEPRALQTASAASPLAVEVGHDSIDPKEADPFNLRGLWGRKQFKKKTFQCEVYEDYRSSQNRHRRVIEENVYHGPFRLDRLVVSYEDLMKQGAPLPQIADSFQERQMNDVDRATFEAEAQDRSFYKTKDDGESQGGLMDMWRESIKSQTEISSAESASDTRDRRHELKEKRPIG